MLKMKGIAHFNARSKLTMILGTLNKAFTEYGLHFATATFSYMFFHVVTIQ